MFSHSKLTKKTIPFGVFLNVHSRADNGHGLAVFSSVHHDLLPDLTQKQYGITIYHRLGA